MEDKGNTLDQQPQGEGIPEGGQAADQTGETQEVQQQNATPTFSAETLALLQEKANQKYGGDLNKAIEGLTNAEKKMHEVAQTKSRLEKELEEIKSGQSQAHQPGKQASQGYPSSHPSQWGEDDRERFINEKKMDPEVYYSMMEMNEISNLPFQEMMAETKLETLKNQWKNPNSATYDPNFTPEVEATFDSEMARTHPRDRMIPQFQKQALKHAKGANIDGIMNSRLESLVKAEVAKLTGNPATPPATNKPGAGSDKPVVQKKIDPVTLERIKNLKPGLSDDQITQMYGD